MLNRLVIERFRGFTRLEVKIPKVLALMGPNSSGKTTALHAIRIACQAIWTAVAADTSFKVEKGLVVLNDFVIRDIAQLMPIADWQALFVDQRVGQGIEFGITLEFDSGDPIESIRVAGKYARNENLKIAASLSAPSLLAILKPIPPKSKDYKTQFSSYLSRHLPRAILIPPSYGVIRDEEYRTRVVVDAMVGSADQSHVVRNMISGLSTAQFQQLNSFLGDMIGAELVQRTQGDAVERESPLRVTFRDSNGEMEISAAGAGLVNLVAIYSSLSRWQDESAERQIIFLLDEPEAHLHPRLQSSTADRLATVITQTFGAQLIMATHSIDIVNRIGQREDAAIFRTDRLDVANGGQELSGQAALVSDLSSWADMTPFSIVNFLASKRIFFHEGKTDDVILRKCADILFRNNPAKKRQFDLWTFVRMEGSGNEKLAGLLSRLVASNAFALAVDNSRFTIVTQLDKDYRDEVAALAELPDSPIPLFRNLWTRHSIESLFCEAEILHAWLAPAYPEISEPMLLAAIDEANHDEELNQYAREQRQDWLLKQLPKTTDNITATNRQAFTDVQSAPAVWHRGKDRASAILLSAKTALGTKANSLSTSLNKVIDRADVNLFPAGNFNFIPGEAKTLLEWMASH